MIPPIRLCLIAVILSGCGELPPPTLRDAFNATGEVIALSGGDAGANNACHTCHGLAGEGNSAGAPRLAGMPYGYLVKQLEDYASGRRKHAAMRKIALGLDTTERQAVARWYAQRDVPHNVAYIGAVSPAAAQIWLVGDAERDVPACALCHGRFGEGVGDANPPLHSQPAPYLAEQLYRWRTGERQNGPDDVMLLVSRRLTDREIADLAAHAARLPGATAAAGETAPSRQGHRPDQ